MRIRILAMASSHSSRTSIGAACQSRVPGRGISLICANGDSTTHCGILSRFFMVNTEWNEEWLEICPTFIETSCCPYPYRFHRQSCASVCDLCPLDPRSDPSPSPAHVATDTCPHPSARDRARIDSWWCSPPAAHRTFPGTRRCVCDSYTHSSVCRIWYRIRLDSSLDGYTYLEIWGVSFDSHWLLAVVTAPGPPGDPESFRSDPKWKEFMYQLHSKVG